MTKEIASVRSIAEPVRKTAQEIARHTELESSEATSTDLAFESKPDIDLTDDPAMCGEYSLEIYQYQRCLENEEHYIVWACFLDHQVEFTAYHCQTLHGRLADTCAPSFQVAPGDRRPCFLLWISWTVTFRCVCIIILITCNTQCYCCTQ